MSRRAWMVAVVSPLLVLGVGGVLLLMLAYEPGHYRRAHVEADRRPALARKFSKAFFDFWNASQSNDRDWNGKFTDEQINSFFQTGQADRLFPEGISDPRVVFDADRMRLSFRYRGGLINTIISVSMKMWLPGSESNVLALQLERIDAGLVPFTAQWLLERISEVARNNGIEVTWFRYRGYPVALIRFQADQPRPSLQLKAVQLERGAITIHGRSGEGPSAPTP